MKLTSFKIYIEEAFKSLGKNKLMSFASIITVASCIFILSISFCIAENITYILKQVEDSVGLCVIIKDELSSEGVDALYKKIVAIDFVGDVKYTSSSDAFAEFSESLGENAVLLEGLEKENILPRSFDIMLKDNRYYGDVINKLENLKADGVESVKHAKEQTDILMSISNIIRIASGIIILILALISVIIITNTIKLAVSNRKDEISIMKYVGATNWFIRWPFIIEGMLIGIIGAFIPVFIGWLSYDWLINLIYNRLPIIESMVSFQSAIFIFIKLFPMSLGLGVVIGIIGSSASVKKYLEV